MALNGFEQGYTEMIMESAGCFLLRIVSRPRNFVRIGRPAPLSVLSRRGLLPERFSERESTVWMLGRGSHLELFLKRSYLQPHACRPNQVIWYSKPPDTASSGHTYGAWIKGEERLMAYPVQGSMDPTPEEVRARISAHARGETHFTIASRYKISVQASKQFKQRHRSEIEMEAERLWGGIRNRNL